MRLTSIMLTAKMARFSSLRIISCGTIILQSGMIRVQQDKVHSSNLRLIARHCVVNASTRTAIWQAARLSTCASEGSKGRKVYTSLDDGFYAILGSANGASTMRMLLDHKSKIGYRTIERIEVLGCERPEQVHEFYHARTVLILLSDRRWKSYIDYANLPSKIPRPSYRMPLGKARVHWLRSRHRSV